MEKSCKQDIRVSLLLTGSELLSGRITDTNSLFIEQELIPPGLHVTEKRIVSDDLESITGAIKSLVRSNDILIINGGLGSTDDDLTRIAASRASTLQLVENQTALAHLQQRLGYLPIYNSPQHSQAMLPEGASIIKNSIGSALGFCIQINSCQCFFLPGVPREMKTMFRDEVVPMIQRQFELKAASLILSYTLIGLGEMQIQKVIKAELPESIRGKVTLGFKVDNPLVELKLIFSRDCNEEIQGQCCQIVTETFAKYICSTSLSLAERVVELARLKGEKLAFAESCTGGKIASAITAVPGSSDIFEFGLVTYSNESKSSLLQVPQELIEKDGAVSESVAKHMVQGVLQKGLATVAASVTGIAGPAGGSAEKPVGTVYIAWGNLEKIHVRKFLVKQPRNLFQRTLTLTTLDLLRRFILGESTEIAYRFDELTKSDLQLM